MNRNIYLPLLSLILMLSMAHSALAQCGTGTFTTFGQGSNPANSGSQCDPSQCNFEFEVCFDVLTFDETTLNSLHGVYIYNSAPGATTTITMGAGGGEQPTAGGGFNWIFLDEAAITAGGYTNILSLPLSPGFYVDDGDGDPTNNLGDSGDGCAAPCTETFTLDPFCFNVLISGCATGSYSPGIALSGDGETGSNISPEPYCFTFGYLPGQDPLDELGPNCDGDIYFTNIAGHPNDLPMNAENLDAMITAAVNADHGWECDSAARIFSSPTLIPRECVVENDGADACDATAKNDIWFSFTGGSNVWLDIYRGSVNPDNLAAALYSGTPAMNASGCAISGLTYIDCGNGDTGAGGDRDVGKCTTPLQERIDVSGLNLGETYYLRVWQVGGTIQETADFFICVEKSTPVYPGLDHCGGLSGPTIGCLTSTVNGNINESYPGLSNAGTFGNSQPGCEANNGQAHVGNPVGVVDENCDGIDAVQPLFFINNVVNNNVIYSFEVLASNECLNQAEVTLTFENVDICCGGGVFQVVVTPADCAVASPVMAISVDPADLTNACFSIYANLTGTLANGLYVLSLEGQDGKLIKYDLTIDVFYSGALCDVDVCQAPLPVELAMFKGKNEGMQNVLEWMTTSEINSAWHILERSSDGFNFREIARLEAEGDSDVERYYSYTDRGVPVEAYYRLKTVDFDGRFEYSEIIYLYRPIMDISELQLYPNPAQHEVMVQFDCHKSAGKIHLEVFDMMGNLLAKIKKTDHPKGTVSLPVNVAEYENGIYFIRVYNGEDYITERLVVDRMK